MMFAWMDSKPDHPMYNVEEAKKLLAELPQDNPRKALEDVTDWLHSFRGTPGFSLNMRIAVAKLLDETGQPLHAELLHQYLSEPHLQDFNGMRLWRVMHDFAKAVTETYALCVSEYLEPKKSSAEAREQMAVLCTRLLRAAAEQMKLELMRYLDVEQGVWGALYRHYLFAERQQLAETMVIAYPGQAIHTSVQRELLRALALYESSPGTMAPDQIEVSYRIAARMVSFFSFGEEPAEDRPYFIELDHPLSPGFAGKDPQLTEGMRFFGLSKALSRLDEIIGQNEHGELAEERRFGSEFTPDGKLTVLKHLHQHWGKQQQHRHQDRRGIHSEIEVVHGFKTVSQLVAHVELDSVAGLSEEETDMLKQRSPGVGLAEVEQSYAAESWPVLDMSTTGLGALMPQAASSWVKIGMLCGLKGKNADLWWVGMVRRLHTDNHNKVHAGIEILTKKPLSLWLRALGKGKERISDWATSSGSFAYDYLPVILLPDTHNAYVDATMLLESGNYAHGAIFEAMMGEKSRNIKLVELLAEGDDYEQVKFEWLDAE